MEGENFQNGFLDFLFIERVSAERVDVHGDRVGVTDCVGELDFATFREAGSDDIFCDVASHVGRGAVDLGGVFPGECASPVATGAAVGVDDDFASSEARVALWTADDESSGRVDEETCAIGEKLCGEFFANDLGDQEVAKCAVADFGGVLGGDDDVRDANDFEPVVFDRDLTFCIGPQPAYLTAFPDACEGPTEAVSEHDGGGHEFGGFGARIAEHDSLIAGALLSGVFPFCSACVDALCNVGRLAGDEIGDEDLVGMEDVVVIDISNFADGFAHDGGVVEVGLGGDFASDDDDIAFGVGFARDAGGGVDGETGVEDGVGDGVADFVGVAFADGFGGEDVAAKGGVG